MQDTFTVALMTDYGWCETCHPLAIGVDKATANSIYRHFDKLCGEGEYVMVASQQYCTNHKDFEKEVTLDDICNYDNEEDW